MDAVAEAGGDLPDIVEILVAEAGAERTDRAHRITIRGVKVEVIETESLPDSLEDIAEGQRLFVLAHRWGLLTATPMTIQLEGTETAATGRVATRSSLVAMKLHAAIDRADEAKRASDVYDIYRLLQFGAADACAGRCGCPAAHRSGSALRGPFVAALPGL